MMLSLFGSFIVVGWWYVLFLVHSLSLYVGNNGFLECVDVKQILNTKNRSPITHNVMTLVTIVFVDVIVKASSLMSLSFQGIISVSSVCFMLLSLRATA